LTLAANGTGLLKVAWQKADYHSTLCIFMSCDPEVIASQLGLYFNGVQSDTLWLFTTDNGQGTTVAVPVGANIDEVQRKVEAAKRQYLESSPRLFQVVTHPCVVEAAWLIEHKRRTTRRSLKEDWKQWAYDEVKRAGLLDKDSDYDGMIGDAIQKIVDLLADQDHSGGSMGLVTDILGRIMRYEPLTPLTSDPSEWMDRADVSGGNPNWQSVRKPSCFSRDGGRTWYDLDDSKWDNGDSLERVRSGQPPLCQDKGVILQTDRPSALVISSI
jgi:hypothetical protein